jgi:hypothetical protein
MHTSHRTSWNNGVASLLGAHERPQSEHGCRPGLQRQETVGPGDETRRESMPDIFQKIDAHTQQYLVRPWAGTFRDYLPMVLARPKLARLAHARLYDMVCSHGVDVDDHGNECFRFFARDLFGIDAALARVMEYLKAAAMGSEVGKRILMLYGPPSSGKSQLVILLKRGASIWPASGPTA